MSVSDDKVIIPMRDTFQPLGTPAARVVAASVERARRLAEADILEWQAQELEEKAKKQRYLASQLRSGVAR